MVTVRYTSKPEKKRIRTERIQLMATGFSLIVILLDPLENPTLFSIAVRVTAVILGVVLVVSGAKYNSIKNVLDCRLETILTRLSGVVLILSGILLKIEGSGTVYAVQIVLGLVYIIVLPSLFRRGKGVFLLSADETGVTYRRIFRSTAKIPWEDIDTVSMRDTTLTIKRKNHSKPETFYLTGDNKEPDLLREVFEKHANAV